MHGRSKVRTCARAKKKCARTRVRRRRKGINDSIASIDSCCEMSRNVLNLHMRRNVERPAHHLRAKNGGTNARMKPTGKEWCERGVGGEGGWGGGRGGGGCKEGGGGTEKSRGKGTKIGVGTVGDGQTKEIHAKGMVKRNGVGVGLRVSTHALRRTGQGLRGGT